MKLSSKSLAESVNDFTAMDVRNCGVSGILIGVRVVNIDGIHQGDIHD